MHLSPHYRFGQAPDTAITERDPRSLDRKELEEYAEYARDGYVEIYNIARQLEQRNVELKKEYTRVLSFSSCLSSNSEFPRTWIRGHIDSPNETSSWMCFGERIKHPVVVVFSPGGSLKTASKHQLMEGKSAVQVAKFILKRPQRRQEGYTSDCPRTEPPLSMYLRRRRLRTQVESIGYQRRNELNQATCSAGRSI